MSILLVDLLALPPDHAAMLDVAREWINSGHGVVWITDANQRHDARNVMLTSLPQSDAPSQTCHVTTAGRDYLGDVLRFILREVTAQDPVGGAARPHVTFRPTAPIWHGSPAKPDGRPCCILTSEDSFGGLAIPTYGARLIRLPRRRHIILPLTA